MGDGINDAPALQAADVGISVDTAVDIAKESADIILLEKTCWCWTRASRGPKVFANILKYVRMGGQLQLRQHVQRLGASVFLPFLPMAPIQVLTNNLLYDFSQTADPDRRRGPRVAGRRRGSGTIGDITRFILFIGPISSIFDYTTFFHDAVRLRRLDATRALFQTGWFVESLLTQTLIIHVIRTAKIPFLRAGRAGR